MTIRSQK